MARKTLGFPHDNMPGTGKLHTERKLIKDIPLVKATTTALNTERIKSAIAKGKQTLLPCETQGQNLFKFEHNGRDGPLIVFAQEAFYNFDKFGHYKVITALKPAESVRNQLFFANESTKHNKEVLINSESSHVSAKHVSKVSRGTGAKEVARMDTRRFVDRKGSRRDKKPLRTQITNPDSFEELIERYKSRRVMYKDLMGTGHVEVLDKLDGLYRQRKQERLKLQEQFSNLGEIRTEINASTGLRDHIIDLEEASKEAKDSIKLPRIRVSTVSEITKKESRRNIDRKFLAVPKEKRTGALKLGKLGAQVDVDSLGKRNKAGNYETITESLPKLWRD